ncbi:DUF2064 domain-containing protein [Schumannella luteola]|uniref:DUF2064 domain-containing protein n=1 Tax=Schumannella luteola TaxID=472059 RepID=A0A852YCV5_9MICO|nr:DUF2064 domain-containing protein [Schumannella luteola]NYG99104.1 hypothetical protein [Schumannella luteola]TPX06452.1 DUF2064 domain-containing protein [Schumannella luteola]
MTTVALIAKECRPGRVKTRLHPPLTLDEAAEVAAASLADTIAVVRELPATRRVLFFDGEAPADLAAGFDVLPQPEGGLDARLGTLFDAIDGALLLVGMDTPQLAAADMSVFFGEVEAAEAGAGDHPAAWFGPALDGGFWALGMTSVDGTRGDLIRGVPMSRDDTGAMQRRRLVGAGLSVRDLPPLRDLDTVDDLRAITAEHPRLRTARVFAGLREGSRR